MITWLRFDIPYSGDAKVMRITTVSGGQAQYQETSDIVKGLESAPASAGNAETVMVFPHDGRHSLAWQVKEAADARGWQFARHVPAPFEMPPEWPMTNEGFSTGSPNETWDEQTLFEFVRMQNSKAHECYQSGTDLLVAINLLREALQVIWHHKGWLHPASLYSLRNYCYVVRGTGNPDNELDALRHIARLAWQMQQDSERDSEAMEFIGQLAQLAHVLGRSDLAGRLR